MQIKLKVLIDNRGKVFYQKSERVHTFELMKETIGSISAMTNFPALMKGTLPDGDMCSALERISSEKSRRAMWR